MKLLITGGAGFIGSELVGQALTAGHEVLVLDALTYAGHRRNLAFADSNPKFTFAHCDIRDAESVNAYCHDFAPEVIFNLAAESHVDRSIAGADDFLTTNILGTKTMLEAARTLPQPAMFVQVSTDEVFGDLGPHDPPFNANSPYRPSSPYSASKAAADQLVMAWARTYVVDTRISYCGNNFGPRQFPEKLIPVVIRAAQSGQPIPIYGDGSNRREWIYVSDHARGLLAIMHEGAPGGRYCLGGGTELSNLELVRLICTHLDQLHPQNAPHDKLIEFVSDRPGHDLRYALDGKEATLALNWATQTDFDEALGQTIGWYCDQLDWWEADRHVRT